MPTIQHSVTIERPVTICFRFVSDFSNSPQWQPSSVRLERAGQIKSVGDMIVGQRRLAGRMAHVNADVVDFVPNQVIAFSGIMGSYPFRTTYKFSFASGGCTVNATTDIRIPWYSFMFRPFVLSSLNGQMQQALANLKKALEARSY